MITPLQIRAARGILNWTQKELAEKAKITQSTIANIESEKQSASKNTLAAIARALQNAGVELLDSGVRKSQGMFELSGDDVFLRLLGDVYRTLTSNKHELLITGADERQNIPGVEHMIDRIRKANIKMRVLVEQNNKYLLGPLDEYRCIPSKYFSNVPSIIYGNRVAVLFVDNNKLKAQVFINGQLAEAQRKLFNFMWDMTEPPAFSVVNQTYSDYIKSNQAHDVD